MNHSQPVVIIDDIESFEDPGTTLGHIMISAPTSYLTSEENEFEVIRNVS
jgi:hypothetical protein